MIQGLYRQSNGMKLVIAKLLERSLNQHIYLTGYRGSGKSSVGRILAETLGLPFVDLDDEVESTVKKSIREIFQEGGEKQFRDLETQCLVEVSQRAPSVIALGGGAILRAENRDCMAATGKCFWLVADAETLLARINADATTAERRPSLTELPQLQEVEMMLQNRKNDYKAAADHCIDVTDLTAQQVAQQITKSIN